MDRYLLPLEAVEVMITSSVIFMISVIVIEAVKGFIEAINWHEDEQESKKGRPK